MVKQGIYKKLCVNTPLIAKKGIWSDNFSVYTLICGKNDLTDPLFTINGVPAEDFSVHTPFHHRSRAQKRNIAEKPDAWEVPVPTKY